MIASAALLLFGAAAVSPTAQLQPNALPEIFQSACLDGEARLSPGLVEPVEFGSLPSELRRPLGFPSSSKVWRLNGPGRAFLYILEYQSQRTTSPRVCGLASDQMNYAAAADSVEMRVTGAVHPRSTQSTEWLNVKAGYDALATTAGDFKVLQINWLSESAKRELLKAQPAIP